LLFASHESENQKNNLIWNFESKTRSIGKPWTGVIYIIPCPKEERDMQEAQTNCNI